MFYISAQFHRKALGEPSDPQAYDGNLYTYQTEIPDLKPGDFVKVDGKGGTSVVRVAEVGLEKPFYPIRNVIEKVPTPEPKADA